MGQDIEIEKQGIMECYYLEGGESKLKIIELLERYQKPQPPPPVLTT